MTPPPAVRPVRVALIDLYNGEPNQGMRALGEILARADGRFQGQPLAVDRYETRLNGEAPGLDYDVYVSSGGPGSPFEGVGQAWEDNYFRWLDGVWNHNQRETEHRKHVLFICHSFQMMCRFFDLAEVIERHSPSFGIFPVHQTGAGRKDPLFAGLPDPFFAADFRHWQAVQPRQDRLAELGAEILAFEKMRKHVDRERAVMAIRLAPELVGVQFHPEADPPGMRVHFLDPARAPEVIRRVGEEKYQRILQRLTDPFYLRRTYDVVVPNFLRDAVAALRPDAVPQAA